MNPQPNNSFASLPRRKALLLTGLGIGALALGACGESTDNTSSSTGETDNKENTNSQSGEGKEKTQEKKYSGGGPAPNGEYRPADEQGPAQNVPKPTEFPHPGYKEPSPTGLKKTIFAWNMWNSYGVQTGDFAGAAQFVSSEFTKEQEVFKENTKLYREGGWIIDGIQGIELGDYPVIDDDGTHWWAIVLTWEKEITVYPNGEKESIFYKGRGANTYVLKAKHDGTEWRLHDVVTGKEYKELHKE